MRVFAETRGAEHSVNSIALFDAIDRLSYSSSKNENERDNGGY